MSGILPTPIPSPSPTPHTPNPTITNINVGILGHVDSGKTTLSASLASLVSTASMDKSTESKSRGMTLDLGFSGLQLPHPSSPIPTSKLQFTFVDCPGHASLLKTIIGGSQIIDVLLLILDPFKLFQPQTLECLALADQVCGNIKGGVIGECCVDGVFWTVPEQTPSIKKMLLPELAPVFNYECLMALCVVRCALCVGVVDIRIYCHFLGHI